MGWHWRGGKLPHSVAPKPHILTLSLGSAPLKWTMWKHDRISEPQFTHWWNRYHLKVHFLLRMLMRKISPKLRGDCLASSRARSAIIVKLEEDEIRGWLEGPKLKALWCSGCARCSYSRITWRKEVTMKYEEGDLRIGWPPSNIMGKFPNAAGYRCLSRTICF